MLPTLAGVMLKLAPVPEVVMVPLLVIAVATVKVLPAKAKVAPEVIFSVGAIIVPLAVYVGVPLGTSKVRIL